MAKINANLSDEELERISCENMGLSKLAQINEKTPTFGDKPDTAKRSKIDKWLSRKRKALNKTIAARYDEEVIEETVEEADAE